jgi:TP901 family phage tail tape measure protein
MADEGRIIRSGDASKFADAAAATDRAAKAVGEAAGKVEKAAKGAEDTAERVQRIARKLEYEVARGPGGSRQFQVLQRDVGSGRGASLSYHRTQEAAERAAAKRAAQDEIAAIARAEKLSQVDAERRYKQGARIFAEAEQAKTAIVRQETAKRVQALTDAQRRTVRKAAQEGGVHFDEGLVPEQVRRARELEKMGMLEQSYRSRHKGLMRVGFRPTRAGIEAVDDDGSIRRDRAELAEREIDDARKRHSRARNADRKRELGELVSMYERDIDMYRRAETAKTEVTKTETAKRTSGLAGVEGFDRKNQLAAERVDAIAEAQRLQKVAAQAEGRLKAAQTRLRNLESKNLGAASAATREAHGARIGKAQAAIPKAQASAEEARAAHRTAVEAAQASVDAERVHRRAVSDARATQAADAGAVEKAEERKTTAVQKGTQDRAQQMENERFAYNQLLKGQRRDMVLAQQGRLVDESGQKLTPEQLERQHAADRGGYVRALRDRVGSDAEAVEDAEKRKTDAVQEETRKRTQAIREGLRIVQTEGGGYQVHGPLRGGGTGIGGYTSGDKLRTTTFRKRESAEREADLIAEERAARGMGPVQQQAAKDVEDAEKRKTAAVAEETRKRTEAGRVEGQVAKGNAAEFDRVAGDIESAVGREIAAHEEYEKKVKRGEAPAVGSDEFKRQVAEQRADADAIERQRAAATPLVPRASAGGGGREVLAHIKELEARGEAAVAKELETRETKKLIRAEATERQAREREAAEAPQRRSLGQRMATLLDVRRRQLEDEVRQSRQAPTREPGSVLARIPGREYIPASGRDPSRQLVARGIEIQGPPAPDRRGSEAFRQTIELNKSRSRIERVPPGDAAAYEAQRAALQGIREESSLAAVGQGRFATSVERAGITMDLSSQRFRKHGALTTEFIEAAAKGEVTMRELGYQVTATIGKFAGWTAAASAVYGVTAALAQMAEGAIASESGVQKVSRVVTDIDQPGKRDEAREGFRRLSEKFNVPISDAVDATYGAGKIFGQLAPSLDAAESSLFAFKVGELDAASATESLNAIVKGFRLEANQLPGVFDAINNVTNRFGGNVGKLVQGVGKAGGLFASSGGTPEQLIALLSAGSQETGAPATEVATAITRFVSGVRTKQGAARARAAGLDPTLDPFALIQQAGALAKGESPERVQEIVRSIIPAGGQFSRILTPMILQMDRLNRTLAETTPAARQGSAQKELARALAQPNEQMGMLVTGLQQVGAAAADAGLLTPFVALLKTLNFVLDRVEDLFSFFNKVVPDPLQPILASALELYAVLRLMRRFDIGGQIKPGGKVDDRFRSFLGATPERRERRQVTQGLGAMDRYLRDTRERVGREAAQAAYREQQSGRRLFLASQGGDQNLIARRTTEMQRASERAADLADEEADLRKQINHNDVQRNRYLKEVKQGAASNVAAQRAGITYMVPTVDRPTTQGPLRINDGETHTPSGVILPGGSRAARDLEDASRKTGKAAAEATRAQQSAAKFSAAMSKWGVSGRAIGGAAGGAANAARAARGALTGAASGLRAAVVGLGELLGPLDLIIIGVFAAIEVGNRIKQAQEKRQAELDRAVKLQSGGDAEKMIAEGKRLEKEATRRPILTRGGLVDTSDKTKQRIGRNLQNTGEMLKVLQARGVNLTVAMIQDQLKDAQAVAGGRGGRVDALRTAIKEIDSSIEVREGGEGARAARELRANLAAEVRLLASTATEVELALREVNKLDDVTAITEAQGARFELGGARRKRPLEGIAAAFIRASEIYGRDQDPAAYLQALQAQEQAVIQPAQERLDRLLAVARSPAARQRARRGFLRNVRTGLGIDQARLRIDTIGVSNQKRQAELKRLQDQRDAAAAAPSLDPLTGGPALLGGLPGGGSARSDRIARIDSRMAALKDRIRIANRDEKAIRQGLRHRLQVLGDLKRDLEEQEFNEGIALQEAQSTLRASSVRVGLPRTHQLLRDIGSRVRAVIRRFGRDSAEAVAIMQQQRDLIDQRVQQEASLITARAEFRAAGRGPGAAYRERRGGLVDLLAKQRANPQFSEEDILSTRTQLKQGDADERQRQRDEAKRKAEEAKERERKAHQDALDLINARYDYLASLTDSPVKIAQLEFAASKRVLALGGFENAAERYAALADRNRKRRAYEQSITDRKVENATYEHDIGKLTDDAYIRVLQGIMRTMKKGSEARRQMRMTIGRLKHEMDNENEVDLTVGNIRLPTLYEIRRMVRTGTEGPKVSMAQSNVFHINGATDPEATGAEVARVLGTSARSAQRSSGMRG